jgi:hypothetical protein
MRSIVDLPEPFGPGDHQCLACFEREGYVGKDDFAAPFARQIFGNKPHDVLAIGLARHVRQIRLPSGFYPLTKFTIEPATTPAVGVSAFCAELALPNAARGTDSGNDRTRTFALMMHTGVRSPRQPTVS